MARQTPLPEGLYCPNPACSLFGQVAQQPLERHAYYGAERQVIYLCRACRKTFSRRRGTFFFGLQTPRQPVCRQAGRCWRRWRWSWSTAGFALRLGLPVLTKIRSSDGWIEPVFTSRKCRPI